MTKITNKFIQFIKNYKLILLSALLFSLSFPPFNLFFLAYIALIPCLIDLHQEKKNTFKTRFKQGFVFGTIIMAIFHSWFFELKAFAPLLGILFLWSAFSLYLGLFYGLVFGFTKRYANPLLSCLSFSSWWTFFEWVRSFGPIGNAAGALGYSQTHVDSVLQLASLVGVFGISFVCVGINYLIFTLFFHNMVNQSPPPSKRVIIGILLILCAFIFFYGNHRLKKEVSPTYPIAIIQPNHGQHRKLDSSQRFFLLKDHLKFAQKALQSSPSLILFPETITPSLNTKNSWFMSALTSLLKDKNTSIIFGTPIKERGHYYNAVVSVSNKGLSPDRYDKRKLMPFGEYWPFRPLLRVLGLESVIGHSDYSAGNTLKNLSLNGHQIGTGICLESIYPWYARQQVKHGATLLATLVNNAWFFDSKAAEQHLQMSQLRAVENNRYLLQSANTGISAIISPKGTLIKTTTLNKQVIIYSTIDLIEEFTFYTRFGDIIILLCCLFILIDSVIKHKKT